jgi:hypothetical protein
MRSREDEDKRWWNGRAVEVLLGIAAAAGLARLPWYVAAAITSAALIVQAVRWIRQRIGDRPRRSLDPFGNPTPKAPGLPEQAPVALQPLTRGASDVEPLIGGATKG